MCPFLLVPVAKPYQACVAPTCRGDHVEECVRTPAVHVTVGGTQLSKCFDSNYFVLMILIILWFRDQLYEGRDSLSCDNFSRGKLSKGQFVNEQIELGLMD